MNKKPIVPADNPATPPDGGWPPAMPPKKSVSKEWVLKNYRQVQRDDQEKSNG